MNYNFIFTFPDVESLSDRVVTITDPTIVNNQLYFNGPAMPKVQGRSDFLGWEVYDVQGDLNIIYQSSKILTKDNMFIASTTNTIGNKTEYATTLYCRMKWAPCITINVVWDSFDPEPNTASTMAILAEGTTGKMILGEV